ncbi:MAG: hypothetical protein ACE5HF_03480 [Gemmatimonadota bacterium]
MTRSRRAAILAAATLVGMPAAMTGQQAIELDAGTFELQLEGHRIGSEVFALRRRGDRLMAVGRVTYDAAGAPGPSFETGLRLGPGFRIERYELRTLDGPPSRILATRSGGRLRVTTSGPEGERFKEFLSSPGMLILERDVAHHYALLARRLLTRDAGRSRPVTAVIPRLGEKRALLIGETARDTIVIGKERRPALRIRISLAGETRDLWVEPETGRVLRVRIPARAWVATRQP